MLYKCQLCDKRFKNSDSLNTHIKNKHEKIKHHCESCNMLFRTSDGLHRHGLAHHTNTISFKCELCDKAFTTRAFRNRHSRYVHNVCRYDCLRCSKSFDNFTVYKIHKQDCKHPAVEDPNKSEECREQYNMCGICCMECDGQEGLANHLQTHPVEDYIKGTSGCFVCVLCPRYRGRTRCRLTTHVWYKHLQKMSLCNFCGMLYKKHNLLMNHIRHQHTCTHNDDIKFLCYVCSAVYKRKAGLLFHMRSHGVHHNCIVCKKNFLSPDDLHKHAIKFHTAYASYSCYICGWQSIWNHHFMNHMFKHTGKGIMCTVCFETFNEKYDLERHKVDVHSKCANCQILLLNKECADLHFKMSHCNVSNIHTLEEIKKKKKSTKHTNPTSISKMHFMKIPSLRSQCGQLKVNRCSNNELDTRTVIGNEVVEEMKVNQHSNNALDSPTYTGYESSIVIGNESVMLGTNQNSNNRTFEEIKKNKKTTKRTYSTSLSKSKIHFMKMPNLESQFRQLKVNRRSNNELDTRTVIGNEVVEEMKVNQHSSNALDSPTYTGYESSLVTGNESVMLGVNQDSNNRTFEEMKKNKKPTKRTYSPSLSKSTIHFMKKPKLGSQFGQLKVNRRSNDELETRTVIGNEVAEEVEVNQHSSNALDSPTYTGNESFIVIGNEFVVLGVNQDSNNHTSEEIKKNKTSANRTHSASVSKKMRKLRKNSFYRFGQLMRTCMQCKNRPVSTYDSNVVMPMVYKCDILSCGCYFNRRDILILHILACHAQYNCGSIVLNIEHSYSKHHKPQTYFPFHTKHVPASVVNRNGHSYSKAWTRRSHESDIECETFKDNSGCLSAEFELIPLETFNSIIKHQISEHDVAPSEIGASQNRMSFT